MRFRKLRNEVKIICLSLPILVVLFVVYGLLWSTRKTRTHFFDMQPFEFEKSIEPWQISHLQAILNGSVGKSDIEIVISRFNEDVGWLRMYSNITTIYDKAETRTYRLSPESVAPAKLIPLENVGRESHTYLYHIVTNYDKLAELTVFAQGNTPSPGYIGHRKGGGHLLFNSTFHDFVLSPDARKQGRFVFTGAVWLPTIAHMSRTGYNKGSISRERAQLMCPDPPLDAGRRGSSYRFDLDDKNHIEVLRHMSSRCAEENSTTCSGLSFWDKYVKLPRPPEEIAFFSQGAIFAATREQIRRRPLKQYKSLLRAVRRSEDPSESFFCEWFWYYIVTSNISPCPVTGSEFDWAKKRPYYKALHFAERIKYADEV